MEGVGLYGVGKDGFAFVGENLFVFFVGRECGEILGDF